MRLDDYQKWLDAQFLDEGESAPELEAEAAPAEVEPALPAVPAFLSEPPSAYAAEPGPPPYTAPRTDVATSPPPARPVTAQSDETEIPALDQYIPFLQRQPDPAAAAQQPAAAEPEPHIEPEKLESEDFPRTTIAVEPPPQQPQATLDTVPDKTEPEYEPAAARPRPIRAAATAEPAPPIPPERLWNLVPKHLQVLLAIESDDVTQNSYKRQFKESRIELISRLLDPTLSLEDTARLLSVCPTTVRRYTNKGLLTHQRTQGDQRRFKLSDVLAFLETQSRKAM